MIASKNGNYNIVSILLKAGASVYARSNNQLTAYMYAMYYGHRTIINLIASYGSLTNEIFC
jgi:ankyrin repeat protein